MIDRIAHKGKIISLGSTLGKYRWIPNQELAERFKDPNMTKYQLFGLVEEF